MSISLMRNALVYYRIFPMITNDWDLVKIENLTLYHKCMHDVSKDHKGPSRYWECNSDGIFNMCTQEFIYTQVTEGLLERVVEGYNGIIIGFGQTGSGKSFTLGGLQFSEEEFGIAPRVIIDLFKFKNQLPSNIKMSIRLSYTEFSKSNVADLFKDFPNSIDPWHAKMASKLKVSTEYEALKLLYIGEGRKTFANNKEYMSHISTSVLTFHITTANQDFTCPEKISSRLYIIDMAGVDSVGNSSSNFKNPLDIGNANVVKSHMEQFILYLMQNIPTHIQVKARTNPLIYSLGSDLNNKSILRFIGHVKIQKADFKITSSTLRFGQLARGLKPKIREIDTEMNEKLKLQYLQNKIENFQNEKIYNSVLMNQDLTSDLNQDRIQHIQTTIDAYIHNRITELNVLNVAEASEAFKILKGICNSLEEVAKPTQQETTESGRIKRSSKSNSRTSLRNIKSLSRRMKKSKESIASTPEKSKLEFGRPMRKNRSVLIDRPPALGLVNPSSSQLYVKRIGSNSVSLEKPSLVVINRKSTANSSVRDRRESKKDVSDPISVPNEIPKFETAWNAFTNDRRSTYRVVMKPYKDNEIELRKVFLNYQKETKQLQHSKELVESRRNELIEAKMYQQFTALCSLDNITTDSEKICQENLNHAQVKFLEQQEIFLKIQSELKILLNIRRDFRRQFREDFDIFCKENFNVTIPNIVDEVGEEEELLLNEETLSVNINKSDDEDDELSCMEKLGDNKMDTLKKIMEKEIRKTMKLREIKKRKWKLY